MNFRRCPLFVSVWLLFLAASALAEPPRGSITIDRIAEIKYPTDPAWSPDSRSVAFLWDSAGKQELFVATPGQPPVALTDFPVDRDLLQSNISSFAWLSPEQILFRRSGQLWTVSLSSRQPVRVAALEGANDFALSGDRGQLAFVRGGDIWLTTPDGKVQRQLTFFGPSMSAAALTFSPDAKWISFEATRSEREVEDLPFNGNLVRQYRDVVRERRLGVVSVYGGDPVWMASVGTVDGLQWTADGSLLLQEVSPDRRTRSIKVWPIGGTPRTLWEDHDPAYWSIEERETKMVVSPDGKAVAFPSDRSGRIHLYVMPTSARDESQARQLTEGSYLAGASYGSWSPDSRRIAYHHSVDGNQAERFISIVDVVSGKIDRAVTSPGVNIDPLFSPDGATLVYRRTSVAHSLELYTVSARAGATPIRLTDSMPAGLAASDLTAPIPVSFPSRADGKPVPATLIVSKHLDRTRKHPAIVWVHASGAEQNYLAWHPGAVRMYYSMHQYLAQQGFVILTPDARGSAGYGRDWSTGNHMTVGVAETLDIASGADYLKTLDYVDPDRIGVWGLSYGGFQTLQVISLAPTLFRCAIDIAGVTEWETHRPPVHRMGTPSEDPDGYDRADPVRHMDELVRPLLILHGTGDTNVRFSQTLRLLDALLKEGKGYELAVYPGETHYFRRTHVLRDAWRRAEEFFERHLKNGPRMLSH